MIPKKSDLTICFAHVAYQLHAQFEKRKPGIKSFQVWNYEDTVARARDADVLVISGLWRNELLEHIPSIRYIQSIGAGTDQFSRDKLRAHGIRLANASGVNNKAVSDHAIALVLALARRLPEARDNQAKRVWRGMISDLSQREDELDGKTIFVVGLGAIGGRVAELAKAFGMHVIGFRKNPATGLDAAHSVHALSEFKSLLPAADFVVLTCPLTPETENLIDADSLGRMKPSAYVINTARGRCVNEAALIDALTANRIAGAGIDVTVEEPLAASSPLWDLPNAFITPHTGGETRRYEDNVLDILQDNLDRLWRGETQLRNQIV